MQTVLVNWGYIADSDPVADWPADYRVDSPQELLALAISLRDL